jgi:hypothetical protein
MKGEYTLERRCEGHDMSLVQTALWQRAKTLKRVGVGGVVKKKGVEAPNIEVKMEDCEDCTATLSFYVISYNYLSHSAQGGRESWSHFEASQLKEDAIAYERWIHLREKVWGPWYESSSDHHMTTGEDTLERRCEGHAMSSSSECPRVDAMASTSGQVYG